MTTPKALLKSSQGELEYYWQSETSVGGGYSCPEGPNLVGKCQGKLAETVKGSRG